MPGDDLTGHCVQWGPQTQAHIVNPDKHRRRQPYLTPSAADSKPVPSRITPAQSPARTGKSASRPARLAACGNIRVNTVFGGVYADAALWAKAQ